MKNKKVKEIDAIYSINEYNVVRRKKKITIINLLLIQVGICLAVSVGVLALRLIAGNEIISAASVNGFFDFVTI